MIQIIYSGTISKELLNDLENQKESALQDFYEVAIREVQEAVNEGKFLFQTPTWSESPHLKNDRVLFSVMIDLSPVEEIELNEIPGAAASN